MKNYEQYKRIIRFLTSVTILAAEIGIYWFVWETCISEMAGTPFFRKGDWLMIAVYGLLLLFFSKMYGGLKIGYLERGNVLYSQILAVVLVNGFTYLQAALLAKHFLNFIPFYADACAAGGRYQYLDRWCQYSVSEIISTQTDAPGLRKSSLLILNA